MRKLNALLDCADDGLRSLLLGAKIPAWLLGLGTFAAFVLLMMTRSLSLLDGSGMMERLWAVTPRLACAHSVRWRCWRE